MARLLIVAVGLVGLAVTGCGSDEPPSSPLLGWWDGESTHPTFAAAEVSSGEEHCETEDVLSLLLTPSIETQEGRAFFLRDPGGVMRIRPDWWHVERFSTEATLPPTAKDSGFRKGTAALWLLPDSSAAFIVDEGQVERWPSSPRNPGCD